MKSDEEKRKEFRERIKKHEAEENAKREKASKLFNIDEFIADVNEVLEAEVPELNVVVKYKRLTNADLLEISKVKDANKRGLETLFYMLNKADANVTREKLDALDPVVTARITAAITEKTPLFLR